MADSHVIARKFRPKQFDEVIGQESITRTLSNALTSGRVHHAYLFTGARGVGKTTTARIFAKALNCVKGIAEGPCDQCDSCLEIAASRSLDVQEIDAASNTQVERVREIIINPIAIGPARDRYKIFIIDEVHQLSGHSFNALLKTIEEPPSHVIFIMATTDLQKVPDTILSRCQVFEFRTISLKKIVDQLRLIAGKIEIEISDAALFAIARAGDGSMRDAESALDQVISFTGNKISEEDVSSALGLVDVQTLNESVKAIGEQNSRRLVQIVEDVVSRGYDLRNFCRELMTHLRAVLVVKLAGFDAELVQLPETESQTLARLAEAFSEQDLVRFFSILTKTEQDIRTSPQPRFQLEIALMKLVQARRLYLLEEALDRLSNISAQLGIKGEESGAPRPSSTRAGSAQASNRSSWQATTRAGGRATSAPSSTKPLGNVSSAAAKQTSSADDPYEGAIFRDDAAPGSTGLVSAPATSEPIAEIDRIKQAIERKGKRFIDALDKANSFTLEENRLCVSYSDENAKLKEIIENSRRAIEQICLETVGRTIKLSASIGGAIESSEETKQPRARAGQEAETDPKLRALRDKFRGEIVEVITPDSR